MIETTRLDLIKGSLLLFAAPAIVRIASIMPVKVFPPNNDWRMFYDIAFDNFMCIGKPDSQLKSDGWLRLPVPPPNILKKLHNWVPNDLGITHWGDFQEARVGLSCINSRTPGKEWVTALVTSV